MLVMYLGWLYLRQIPRLGHGHQASSNTSPEAGPSTSVQPLVTAQPVLAQKALSGWHFHDIVDIETVDLRRDEYQDNERDVVDDEQSKVRLSGQRRWLWRLYYWLA